MSSVHCSIAPPAAVRLLESESRHFSEFTVLGFLPSTADASVVPRHGRVHLGLGDYYYYYYSYYYSYYYYYYYYYYWGWRVKKEFTALKVPRLCPFVILVQLSYKQVRLWQRRKWRAGKWMIGVGSGGKKASIWAKFTFWVSVS